MILNGLLGALWGPACIMFFMWIMQMAFLAKGLGNMLLNKGSDNFMGFMFLMSSPASFFAAATVCPWLIRRLIKNHETTGKNSVNYSADSGWRFGFLSLFVAIFYLGLAMIALMIWRGEFQKDILAGLSQLLLFIFSALIGSPPFLAPGILLFGSIVGILNDFTLRKISKL